MEQYIPKSALVAEIKSRISDIEVSQKTGLIKKRDADKKILLFKSVLSLIDTLEVKEVNLEKEFTNYAKDILACDVQFEPFTHLYNCAKHFFELGLSSQLSWKDIELIDEIGMDFLNSEDSDNLNDEEYYTEILNKFKAQKGGNII